MSKVTIKLETNGIILSGQHQNWYIHVHDDTDATGGYYIYIMKDLNSQISTEGFDCWVEDYETLEANFYSHFPDVHWLNK